MASQAMTVAHPVLGGHWECSVCFRQKVCLEVSDNVFTCRMCRIKKLQISLSMAQHDARNAN
jgi:hypothetical protein